MNLNPEEQAEIERVGSGSYFEGRRLPDGRMAAVSRLVMGTGRIITWRFGEGAILDSW